MVFRVVKMCSFPVILYCMCLHDISLNDTLLYDALLNPQFIIVNEFSSVSEYSMDVSSE